MSFKVLGELKEKDIYFKLEKIGNGISLFACYEDGTRYENGEILIIRNDGTLFTSCDVNEDIQLKLDRKGRIEISGRD